MNTYTIRFVGRKVNAIGAFYPYTATRTAENVDAALLALYDEYEHIQQPQIISQITDSQVNRWTGPKEYQS